MRNRSKKQKSVIELEKIGKKITIDYISHNRKILFYFKFKNMAFNIWIKLKDWYKLIKNCKKQKRKQGKTKYKVFSEISPNSIEYVTNLELWKRYAKTPRERKIINKFEGMFGKGKLSPKNLVSNDVSISIGDLGLALGKKDYFKIRDIIINSERKLKKMNLYRG